MNKEQVKVIRKYEEQGWELIELSPQPKATFYTRDRVTGEVVEMKDLPSDPYSLHHYLSKGFKLNKNDLEPQARKGKGAGVEPVGFTCEVCGKVVSSALALAGHKRTHQTKEEP